MHKLRFRQVHLDFHTSEAIEDIGSQFDKLQFQQALRDGHVNSITCFAKCHHGWSYYDTQVGLKHPNLNFDLLKAQYEVCKEVDVNIPIYLSAGFDNAISHKHPEWRVNFATNSDWAPSPIKANWHIMCFNSPYTEYLCNQIKEVLKNFPDCHGIFLDIICKFDCVCEYCLDWMHENDLDASKQEDRNICSENALKRYYEMTTNTVRSINPKMPIFHNSGHIQRGNRDLLKYISHLELESLPTGGWGYDHFPISAKYCKNLDLDFLGMTGKFHTTWAEFGGYKHPNALKYECAAMISFGAKCSIGDQLHPSGKMDESTYKMIGQAYQQVKECESWCQDTQNIADIGLLSSQSAADAAADRHAGDDADTGAARILLEGHFLFDVIDTEMDFSKYKLILLPDDVRISNNLKAKLDNYLEAGGKLLLSGESGLTANKKEFMFDLGAEYFGPSEFCPDYVLPAENLRPEYLDSPFVMYMRSQRIKIKDGLSIGKIYDPYFNRAYKHFCSHQHTPPRTEPSEFDCGVIKDNICYICYLAHPVFSIYKAMGAAVYKEFIINVINKMLENKTLKTNLPSTARVSLMSQEDKKVLHILYANKINRGGPMKLEGGTISDESKSIEIIEELTPLYNVDVCLNLDQKVESVKIQPQNEAVEFTQENSQLKLKVDRMIYHQMIELKY